RCSILFIVAAVCVFVSTDTQAQTNREQGGLESQNAQSKDAPEFFLPAVANLYGFGGVKWQTNVEITVAIVSDAFPSMVPFTVTLFPRGQDNSTPQEKVLMLDFSSRKVMRIDNILETVFGYQGAAALRFETYSYVDQLIVSARTYAVGPHGTHGMSAPAMTRDDAVTYCKSGTLLQIKQSVSNSTGYRTNMGLFNPNPFSVGVYVWIDVITEDKDSLDHSFEVTLGPFESRQYDKILRMVTVEEDLVGRIWVGAKNGGDSVFAYATPIDNGTGDGWFVSPRIVDYAPFFCGGRSLE
ncbi:MAG: hypothetical protein GY906_02005, partial [bacterium]|nr:hypothetical protein [bacterium]